MIRFRRIKKKKIGVFDENINVFENVMKTGNQTNITHMLFF